VFVNVPELAERTLDKVVMPPLVVAESGPLETVCPDTHGSCCCVVSGVCGKKLVSQHPPWLVPR
jgi:hypothetical protein